MDKFGVSAAPYYREIIFREYARRRIANPRYSMRAYSKFLSISSATLSRLLQGKRELSVDKAIKMMGILELNISEQQRFVLSVAAEKRKAKTSEQRATVLSESLLIGSLGHPPAGQVSTGNSVRLKEIQNALLEFSERAHSTLPVSEQVHTCFMMSLDPKKIERIRALIAEVAADEQLYWFSSSGFPVDVVK